MSVGVVQDALGIFTYLVPVWVNYGPSDIMHDNSSVSEILSRNYSFGKENPSVKPPALFKNPYELPSTKIPLNYNKDNPLLISELNPIWIKVNNSKPILKKYKTFDINYKASELSEIKTDYPENFKKLPTLIPSISTATVVNQYKEESKYNRTRSKESRYNLKENSSDQINNPSEVDRNGRTYVYATPKISNPFPIRNRGRPIGRNRGSKVYGNVVHTAQSRNKTKNNPFDHKFINPYRKNNRNKNRDGYDSSTGSPPYEYGSVNRGTVNSNWDNPIFSTNPIKRIKVKTYQGSFYEKLYPSVSSGKLNSYL